MTQQCPTDPAKKKRATAPTTKAMSSNNWMESFKFLFYEVAAQKTSNQYMK